MSAGQPPAATRPPSAASTTPSGALGQAIRRVLVALLVIGSLGGGALTVRLAAAWVSVAAQYPEPVVSIAQLTEQVAAEQARAESLQAQLDDLVAGSTDLAGALADAGTRLGGDASTAESLRAGLAVARARLAALQQALSAASGVSTRQPASSAAGTNLAARTAATAPPAGGTVPVAASAPAAYPPGVPADWPASQPIPSMPAGCVQPQLELNGQWNCQH